MKITAVLEVALALASGVSLIIFAVAAAVAAPSLKCPPTPEDALGPMYEPNAPERASIGKGYVLSGMVKSAKDCAPIGGARIEFWQVGPNGKYDDDHRATVKVDQSGAYRFESNFPPSYLNRPSHIHLKVSAPGFRTLVTQHYPQKGQRQATLDLVLVPEG